MSLELNSYCSLQISDATGAGGFIRYGEAPGRVGLGNGATYTERSTATFRVVAPRDPRAGGLSLEAAALPGHYLVLGGAVSKPYLKSNYLNIEVPATGADAAVWARRATFRAKPSSSGAGLFTIEANADPGREPYLKRVVGVLMTGLPGDSRSWPLVTWRVQPALWEPPELWDTANPAVCKQLREVLGQAGIGSTTLSTPSAPDVTRIGVLVPEFQDVTAGGTTPANHWAKMQPERISAWLTAESNGRFAHHFDVFPQIVSLPMKRADIGPGDEKALLTAIDAVLDLPDAWQIVIVCMPDVAGLRGVATSQCGPFTYDTKEYRPTAYVDAAAYDEQDGRTWSVALHELLHTLCLPDLYQSPPGRSYGWSMMCDCRSAWHLLGWERLLLGWDAVEDWVFVKSGLADVDIVQAGAAGKKGVVILDPRATAARTGSATFVEWSRPTGRTEAQRDAASRPPDGLLTYRVTWGSRPPITLYPAQTDDPRAYYGGASHAPFVAPTTTTPVELGRNAEVVTFLRATGTTARVRVGQARGFAASNFRAAAAGPLLRIDECLVTSDRTASVSLTDRGTIAAWLGDRSVPGTAASILKIAEWAPVAESPGRYAFFAELDVRGVLVISHGTGPDDRREVVVATPSPSIPVPANAARFLAVEAVAGSVMPALRVYQGASPADPARRLLAEVLWTRVLARGAVSNELTPGQFLSLPGCAQVFHHQEDLYPTMIDASGEMVWHIEARGDHLWIGVDGVARLSWGKDVSWRATKPFTLSATLSHAFAFRLNAAGNVEVVQGDPAGVCEVLYTLR